DPKSRQYRRTLAPETHLHLAKSYEATHDAAGAIDAYKKYAAFEPGRRADVEGRIATLRAIHPVFEPPAAKPKMAEEARVLRLNLPVVQPRLAEPAAPRTPTAVPDSSSAPVHLHVRTRVADSAVKPADLTTPTDSGRDDKINKTQTGLISVVTRAGQVPAKDANVEPPLSRSTPNSTVREPTRFEPSSPAKTLTAPTVVKTAEAATRPSAI